MLISSISAVVVAGCVCVNHNRPATVVPGQNLCNTRLFLLDLSSVTVKLGVSTAPCVSACSDIDCKLGVCHFV